MPKIHPIIIYPYKHPKDIKHLQRLYEWLKKLQHKEQNKYNRPITVISGDTEYSNTEWAVGDARKKEYQQFQNYIEAHSKRIVSWSVDTCQRWLTGFGAAIEKSSSNEDVYWLIPGDFDYANSNNGAVFDKLEELPLKVYKSPCELCLGEISVPLNSSKQLIDTYGTYGLLYNWFPAEAQGIRTITDKPRTEFFAITQEYLVQVLQNRWYAYEQTLVILLQGMRGRKPDRIIHNLKLGEIQDNPANREHLASAMEQVERMERMFKQFWREEQLNAGSRTWIEDYRRLDLQSEQIRGTALVILQQILTN